VSDAGRYRKLFTRLWLHPGFTSLSDAEKVLAFYLLTGPQTNRIGLYRLSPAQAAEDLGTTVEPFRKRLATVCVAFGWLFDADARVMYIPSWWRWNPPSNENVTRGSLKDLNDLPPCGLVEAFARNIETIPEPFHEAFRKGLHEQLRGGFRNQDQYRDLNQKKEQETRAARGDGSDGTKTLTPSTDARPSDRLISIARETIKHTGTKPPLEELADHFRHYAGNAANLSRTEIFAALNVAILELRVSA
jgi:hypothetical protein